MQWRHAPLPLILAVWASTGVAGPASAASIENGEGGVVAVKAYGETMRFVRSEGASVGLSFMASGCDLKARPTLNDLIESAGVVSCLTQAESQAPEAGQLRRPSIHIFLPVAVNRLDMIYSPVAPGLPLRKLANPPRVAGTAPSLTIMVASWPMTPQCEGEASAPDSLGYQRSEAKTQLKSVRFRRPPILGGAGSEKALCVTCNPLAAYSTLPDPQWMCSTNDLSADRRIVWGLRWLTQEEPKPDPDWASYEAFSWDVARAVFSDGRLSKAP